MTTDVTGLQGKRVLIAEDEILISMLYEEVLREYGCEVVGPALTVDHALSLIAAHELDGALLDANLHGRLSTPVAERLERRGVPFLLVTGYESLVVADPVLTRAPRLLKPVNPRKIVQEMTRTFCAPAA